MHTCPHCQAQSITAWRKFTSSRTTPASCANCGGLSHVAFGWWEPVMVLLPEFFFWAAIVLAIALHNAWYLIAFPVGVAVLMQVSNALTVLQPIQADAVSAARLSALRQIAFGAVVVLLAYLAFGRH